MFDGIVYVPEGGRSDTRPVAAVPALPTPGAPLIPTGDPLVDGVGPASYAARVDFPERTFEGHDRIVPMRVSPEHHVAREDRDPRGFPVVAADGRIAGTVTDLWVDRSEGMVRYLEIALREGLAPGAVVVERDVDVVVADVGDETVVAAAATETIVPAAGGALGTVLMPIGFANVDAWLGRITTGAITAAQFANVPRIAGPDRVTLAEEDRIVGYFAGGALYATPLRSEPLL